MKKSRKKRGRTTLVPTALVTPRKRPAKVSEQSPGYKTAVLPALERSIVLDRLGKEILPLFKTARDRVRRRLRFGINEVTRFLEGKAAVTSASRSNRLEETTPSPAIVLICNDVKPTRLVEHLHGLVALTGTPHLVLQGASHSLGRMFGCKTMAAFAIGPPSLAKQKQNKVDLRGRTAGERATKSGGSEPIRGIDIDDRRGEAEIDPRDGLPRAPGQEEEKKSFSDSTREGLAETRESERHPEDDDIDSFVDFLKQKSRAPSDLYKK